MANGRMPAKPRSRGGGDIGQDITSPRFGAAGSVPAVQATGAPTPLEDNFIALLQRWARAIPPLESTEFRRAQEQDIAAIAVVQFTERFQVPGDHEGVVTFFQGMSTNADATIAGSSFGIFVDEVPVLGYEAMPIFQAGGTQSVQEDCFIRLKSEQTVSVRFNHALANPHHVGFILKGSYWPVGAAGRA